MPLSIGQYVFNSRDWRERIVAIGHLPPVPGMGPFDLSSINQSVSQYGVVDRSISMYHDPLPTTSREACENQDRTRQDRTRQGSRPRIGGVKNGIVAIVVIHSERLCNIHPPPWWLIRGHQHDREISWLGMNIFHAGPDLVGSARSDVS